MLYKKNNTQTLSKDLFKNPTSEYRGTPFWSWNCELLWQIEQLKKMGFGGFHMHARCGLSTRYLGKDFMDFVKTCTQKALLTEYFLKFPSLTRRYLIPSAETAASVKLNLTVG